MKYEKVIFLPKTIKIYTNKQASSLLFVLNTNYIKLRVPKGLNVIKKGSFLKLKFNTIEPTLISWYFLVKNLIIGLSRKFSERLLLKGIGFKAFPLNNTQIEFKIGYSHPIIYTSSKGLDFEIIKNNIIQLKSPLKDLVGQEATKIQNLRKPDSYKGKGIVYKGETLVLKVGKKA